MEWRGFPKKRNRTKGEFQSERVTLDRERGKVLFVGESEREGGIEMRGGERSG